mmetsp:Transcript_8889/g.13203  ORF Transcript_8889/g.13203 Transcript_8889/m.13203 type:complete len:132 (-) Transcript_8889:28-423(-)
MEILVSKQGQLSNFEVYSLLSDVKLSSSSSSLTSSSFESNVCSFLESVSPSLPFLSSSSLKSFLNDMRTNFPSLSTFELLQFVNLLPSSVVELYLILSDCDSRFSEDDLSHMLSLVHSHLSSSSSVDFSKV